MGVKKKEFFHPVSMFQMKAIALTYRYVKSRMEKTDTHVKFSMDDLYVVWFTKTLQNWKALISTNLPDGMYYEVTYDGEKKRTYIDAYKKFENVVITDTALRQMEDVFGQLDDLDDSQELQGV
jgi:hypothetical protein